MKQLLKRIALVILLLTTCSNIYTGSSIVHAQPPYAKWGKLAVEKTKEQYPKAEIVDYLHIGRKPKTVQITVEKFKLWLREDGKEYGVFVDVEFDTKTEKFIKMSFQKTSR
ncbi:YqzG/YhdC family protein [Bacillus toyonensis]|nr:YqzG/YhdC family protein [Bacillus toyonensis]HDX9610078.1 YqzG/YhdC family protein [Bacillus toyonensis]